MSRRIDLTPSWEQLTPAFLALIESGSADGRAYAISEMRRAFRALDSAQLQAKERHIVSYLDDGGWPHHAEVLGTYRHAADQWVVSSHLNRGEPVQVLCEESFRIPGVLVHHVGYGDCESRFD